MTGGTTYANVMWWVWMVERNVSILKAGITVKVQPLKRDWWRRQLRPECGFSGVITYGKERVERKSTVDVEEGEKAEELVALVIAAARPGEVAAFTGLELVDVGHDVRVGQHHAFWVAGGP